MAGVHPATLEALAAHCEVVEDASGITVKPRELSP
jgi:hypothetical protein